VKPDASLTGLYEKDYSQTRGMYNRRLDGEHTKTAETKAASTGAFLALAAGLFKLC